jgi:hypothetical protein
VSDGEHKQSQATSDVTCCRNDAKPGRNKVRVPHGTLARKARFYITMLAFPIDPELRIRVSPPSVLRRTTDAMAFIRKMALGRAGRAWLDVQQSFEDAWDEWSAMEAVVKLEMLLEAEGLLIEDKPAPASTSSLQNPARAA